MSEIEKAVERVCKAVRKDERPLLQLEKVSGVSARTLKKMSAGAYCPVTIKNLLTLEGLLLPAGSEGQGR